MTVWCNVTIIFWILGQQTALAYSVCFRQTYIGCSVRLVPINTLKKSDRLAPPRQRHAFKIQESVKMPMFCRISNIAHITLYSSEMADPSASVRLSETRNGKWFMRPGPVDFFTFHSYPQRRRLLVDQRCRLPSWFVEKSWRWNLGSRRQMAHRVWLRSLLFWGDQIGSGLQVLIKWNQRIGFSGKQGEWARASSPFWIRIENCNSTSVESCNINKDNKPYQTHTIKTMIVTV